MTSTKPVWLITGASSGFGLALALHVLRASHRVIATVRNSNKPTYASAISKLTAAGATILPLDLSSGDASIASAAKAALEVHGRIDVLVNNAGYAVVGTLETTSDAATRQQLETNVFGPLSLIRALLPGLRAPKSGVVVNFSSVAGFDGLPGCGAYAASKFALEGASESLAKEVGPLGIRVLIVEPGGFRTGFQNALSWAGAGDSDAGDVVGEAYRGGPAELIVNNFRDMADNQTQKGDPVKGAKAVFEAVEKVRGEKGVDVKRVLLGSDALQRMEYKLEHLKRDVEDGREVAHSTDF